MFKEAFFASCCEVRTNHPVEERGCREIIHTEELNANARNLGGDLRAEANVILTSDESENQVNWD